MYKRDRFNYRAGGKYIDYTQFPDQYYSEFDEDSAFARFAGIYGNKVYSGSTLTPQVSTKSGARARPGFKNKTNPFVRTYRPKIPFEYDAATQRKRYAELAAKEARPMIERWKHYSPDYSDLHQRQAAPIVANQAMMRTRSDTGKFSDGAAGHRRFAQESRKMFAQAQAKRVKKPKQFEVYDNDSVPTVIKRFLKLFTEVPKYRQSRVYADMAQTYLAHPNVLRLIANFDEDEIAQIRSQLRAISIKTDPEISPNQRKFMAHITQLHEHISDTTMFKTPIDQTLRTMPKRFESQVNANTQDLLIKMPNIPKNAYPLVKAIVFEILKDGKKVTPQAFARKKEEIYNARSQFMHADKFRGYTPRSAAHVHGGISRATVSTFNLFGRQKRELYKPSFPGDTTTAKDLPVRAKTTYLQRPNVIPANYRTHPIESHQLVATNPARTMSRVKKYTMHENHVHYNANPLNSNYTRITSLNTR